MSQEPKRMLEDPELAADLRAGLEALGGKAVDYDVAAGAARFEASLTPAAGAGTAAATAGSKTTVLVVVAVIAAGAAVAAWALAGGDSKPVAEPEPAVHAEAESPARRDPVAPRTPGGSETHEPPAGVEVHDPRPVPPPEPVPPARDERPSETPGRVPKAAGRDERSKPRPNAGTSRPPKPTPAVDPSEDTPDTLEAEMRATKAAKDALTASPRKALRLARQADEAFPGGVFGPEREGIIALALLRMEADAEARRRAKAYLDAHPKGAYAERVRTALEK